MASPSDVGSRLQLDHDKLLNDCAAVMEQVCHDSARLRSKLGNLPWDLVNASGKGYLEEARLMLMRAENGLTEARKQVELQRERAGRG